MEKDLNAAVWGRLAYHSHDFLCTTDRDGIILHVNDASKCFLGYSSEELKGRRFVDFLHPEDLAISETALTALTGPSPWINYENRIIHKSGRVVYILWSVTWSQEDEVIYAIGRDMTEQKESRRKLEESEQRYKALFENNPDVIYLENKEGIVTEVNQSLCHVLGIKREDAINQPPASFLPPEMIPKAEEAFKEALAGKTVNFQKEVAGWKVFDTVKFPVKVNGEITGVQTVAKDITPIIRAYETIQQQAKKLNTILESITDALLTIDRDWRITYLNSEAERLLPFDRTKHIGVSIWDIFPEEVGKESYIQYHRAFKTGKTVTFLTFLLAHGKWFQVKAYPSEEGLSIYFADVSEQVKTQQELEKLSVVASKTKSSIIITDQEDSIEWVNESFSKLTGYTFSEAVGKKPLELLRRVNPSHPVSRQFSENLQQTAPFSQEIRVYDKFGAEKWLEIEVTPILDKQGKLIGRIRIQTDVTARIEAQRQVETLSLVASKTNNSVIICDQNWGIEWVNEGFTRLFGYTLEEVAGKKPMDLLHSHNSDFTNISPLEANLEKGEIISFQVLNMRKDGEEVWLSVDITPVYNTIDEVVRYIIVQTDVTDLKNSELDLAKLAKELYQQNADLAQFTYIVSHNLRAPVANAMGLSDLLLTSDKSSVRFDQSLTYLRQSVYRLDVILKDINTILSIKDGPGTLEREQVDLNGILKQALSQFKEPLQTLGANVSVEVAEGVSIQANRAYLYSIFYNLLSNAIKYKAEDRRLELHISCRENSPANLLLSFSDNGSGFDSKREEKNLFKLYKRFHTEQEGRGIGLYLVKNHVEAMGGQIEVDSQVDKGTTFLIRLPKA